MIILADGSVPADGTPAEVISGENLRSLYRQDVPVLAHPGSGVPLIVPVGPRRKPPHPAPTPSSGEDQRGAGHRVEGALVIIPSPPAIRT